MEKEFNVTGNCFPDKHYMADVSHERTDILKGVYFIIHGADFDFKEPQILEKRLSKG